MSTGDAAFRLTYSVLKSLNQELYVGGIFCDLSKAFDCVNHEILLIKLHFYVYPRNKYRLVQVVSNK